MKKTIIFGYNLFDLILLGTGLVSLTVVSMVFSSPWYIYVNTILALLCVFTQAKGQVITQFLGIACFIFYIYISFTQKLYGEVILYTFIMMPIYLYGAVHWFKNRNNKDKSIVNVRKTLPKLEIILMLIAVVIIFFGVYYLLKALNTAQLTLSTIAFVSTVPAVYLLARRCIWNQVVFLLNDIFVPIMWLNFAIQGDLTLIVMVIYHIFQIVYDIYGLVVWLKLEKQQKNG